MRKLVTRAGGRARSATPADTAQACEVLLLATPWPAARQVLAELGDLTGKVLIDAMNPPRPKLDGLEVGTTTSAGEQVAAWAPGAKVVKAFNTIGFNIMANPAFGKDRPVLFYCGDDAGAKKKVKQLARRDWVRSGRRGPADPGTAA
jgi:predicted dinucleotide-binding enzyme